MIKLSKVYIWYFDDFHSILALDLDLAQMGFEVIIGEEDEPRLIEILTLFGVPVRFVSC